MLGPHLRRSLAAASLLWACSCHVAVQQRTFTPPAQARSLDKGAPYLKAHLRNGDLYVLTAWSVDDADKLITGKGEHFGPNRDVIERGDLRLPIDSVALFETNVVSRSRRVQSLSVMTGVSAAVTALCLANSKACFGSCPTFYVNETMQAEGFSASVLPSLEATDLDALYRAHPSGRDLEVKMTNEALETHVVRFVRLIAVPHDAGSRVFATADRHFFASPDIIAPTRCVASEGNCLDAIAAFDTKERFSAADPNYLAKHETIDLYFPRSDSGSVGLVIAARQTLLSTFLLYQTLAYLGDHATEAFARLERAPQSVDERAGGIARLLGGIDVEVEDHGRWRAAGSFHETGPLAADVRLIQLPSARSGHVRLRMTKGLWRLDWVALARLDREVQPITIEPIDGSQELVTGPGDAHIFQFKLPDKSVELFLETRGYYLEWMRNEWIAEQSRTRALMMLLAPRLALRLLAPEFKKLEPDMERAFWSSRYASP